MPISRTAAVVPIALVGMVLVLYRSPVQTGAQTSQSMMLSRLTPATDSSLSAVNQWSQNWAGLIQTGTDETSVAASWSVPASFSSQPRPDSAVGEWVGLGGVNSKSLIQIGTITTVGAKGTPVTKAFWESIPKSAVMAAVIPPGTSVTASISPVADAADRWLLTLTAASSTTPLLSTTVTLSTSQAQGIQTSADWITEAPSTANKTQLPLAPLASTTMTALSANSQPLGSSAASLVTIGMAQGPMPVAAPALSASQNALVVNTIYGSLGSSAYGTNRWPSNPFQPSDPWNGFFHPHGHNRGRW